jgi:hypothetical protein
LIAVDSLRCAWSWPVHVSGRIAAAIEAYPMNCAQAGVPVRIVWDVANS